MSKMEVQMVNTEVAGLKDNMWKLSGRVQLMEKFIQKQFGDVFWEFVQEHADPNDYDIPRSPTPPIAPSVTVTLIQSSSSSVNSSASNSESSSSMSTASPSGPPPPPPLIPASSLAALTAGNGFSSGSLLNSSPSSGGGRPGARNFLPKSLSNNAKPKPVVRTVDSLIHHNNHGGAQKIVSARNSDERRPVIKQVVGRGESILKSSLRASPPIASSSNSNNKARPQNSLRPGSTPPTKSLVLKRAVPIDFTKVDVEDDPPEPQNKRMMNTIENLLAYSMPANRSVNIIRTSTGIKAETDGYSAAHNGFLREMRPNPCHTRCQNRCHDIWTHTDRMDVFQVYWSIPTEDERRMWVAERIERVDMATKKTEYSNFRTCTFKYYFPHPENPRVQVCKNFFLATIDEKRSYVEKIAQEVKGISEHYSVQDIPFRRKNQVKGANGSMIDGEGDGDGDMQQYNGYAEVVGWMTGGGMDGQEDQEYDDEYADDGEEVDEMEMNEMMT